MAMNTLALLDLQPQDRIVTTTKAAFGLPSEEVTLYVECADVALGVVHTLSGSGNRLTVPFGNILDVEKCVAPITLVVAGDVWDAHGCDPAYHGKPVRAVAAMLSQRCNFSGLWIPKWPGSKPGHVLTIDVSLHSVGVAEDDILAVLPTNRAHRFHDPERIRNRTKQTARNRIEVFIKQSADSAVCAVMPIDPSLKVRGRMLVQRTRASTFGC